MSNEYWTADRLGHITLGRGGLLASLLSIMLTTAMPVWAGEEEEVDPADLSIVEELTALSLDELLNMPVRSGSEMPHTFRDSPAILTIITGDEILQSGARDLADVLRMVPGFQLALDVYGVVGLGFRGNWVHEGKVMILVDGVPLNENYSGSVQIGSHIPLVDIKHIEIIRGPGSVVYGSYSELAVINIITLSASEQAGIRLLAQYGQMGSHSGTRMVTARLAHVLSAPHGIEATVTAMVGEDNRSTGTYKDAQGTSYKMANVNTLRPLFINGAVRFGGLNLRFIKDDYQVRGRDGATSVLNRPTKKSFKKSVLSLEYQRALNKTISGELHLSYSRERPWYQRQANKPAYFSLLQQRLLGGAKAQLELLSGGEGWVRGFRFVLGGEIYYDTAENDPDRPTPRLQDGETTVNYLNHAALGEGLLETELGNLSAGIRYERHSEFENAFAPRIAYTKVVENVHVKAAWNQGFKPPLVANLAANPTIKAEQSSVFEFEVGAMLGEHTFVRSNFFLSTIRNPIVYFSDSLAQTSGYRNADKTQTLGTELDLRIEYPWISTRLAYSYYRRIGEDDAHTYHVPERDDVFLAFPSHKIAASANVDVLPSFMVSPSLVILSKRFGYTTVNAGGFSVVEEFDPIVLLGLTLRYEDLGIPGLDLTLAVFDMLQSTYAYIQPFDGGHAPLPGPRREIVAQLCYAYSGVE